MSSSAPDSSLPMMSMMSMPAQRRDADTQAGAIVELRRQTVTR
jgi:hypothetical protein